MPKTPDEIKRQLVTCMEINVDKFTPGATHEAMKDALVLIQQLQDQNASLQSLMVAANAEIADLDTEVEELHSRIPRWISVADRLPERGTWVLCCGAKGGMFLSDWIMPPDSDNGTSFCSVPNARCGRHAKYWVPLPEPPKECSE